MASSSATEVPRGNRLLDSLPSDELGDLARHLDAERLELKDVLSERGKPLEHVFFPISAVASLLNLVETNSGVEVATVGNEGLVGLPISWGIANSNPRELVQVQVPGDVLVMDAETFSGKHSAGGAFTSVIQRYTQAFVTQLGQQVACNGLHSVEERCARWLLLTNDRVGADEFPLTQEFLSQMLGVRRPSVTVVAGILQQAGFIRFRRGRVTILDRQGLESAACECYRVLREVFDRLLG
jgi:CRP-like cAMP-binding protein